VFIAFCCSHYRHRPSLLAAGESQLHRSRRRCLLLLRHGTHPAPCFHPNVGPRARPRNLPIRRNTGLLWPAPAPWQQRAQAVRQNADSDVVSWITDAALEPLGQARKSGFGRVLKSMCIRPSELECEAHGFSAARMPQHGK
jgi:hypothetical protein